LYLPGATALGLVFSDGILLASDRRVSWGTFVMSKSGRKVYRITGRIGVASAGMVGDMQILVKEAIYYANTFRLENNREITAHALAKLLSNILFGNRLYPLITQTVVGGFDLEKPMVYVLDPVGSVVEDEYAAVGTGAEVALGVLESVHEKNMPLEKAREVVVRALKAAGERDSATGNGFDLLIITKEGVKEEFIPA